MQRSLRSMSGGAVKAKWTNAQWKEWRTAQRVGWTPDKKKSTQSDEVQARAAELQLKVSSALLPATSSVATSTSAIAPEKQHPADHWGDKKSIAARIRSIRSMMHYATNPLLMEQLETELAEARKVARGFKTQAEAATELTVTLAEAEDKLRRATAHFDTAKAHVDDASKEVERLQADLQELVDSMATSAASKKKASSDSGLQDVARLLTLLQASSLHHDGKVTVDPDILNQISKVIMDGHQKLVTVEIHSGPEGTEGEDGYLTADPYSEMDADGEENVGDSESQASLQARLARTILFPSGAKDPRALKGPLFRNTAIGHRKAHHVPIVRIRGKVNPKAQMAEHKKALETLQEQPIFTLGAHTNALTPMVGTTGLVGASI